jgi:tetrahydromethanopterin S-methyltransferase subunit B
MHPNRRRIRQHRIERSVLKIAASNSSPGPVQLLNFDEIPGREISEILGLVHGHTVYAIWLGKDLSALIRLVLGGELAEYTEMMGSAA